MAHVGASFSGGPKVVVFPQMALARGVLPPKEVGFQVELRVLGGHGACSAAVRVLGWGLAVALQSGLVLGVCSLRLGWSGSWSGHWSVCWSDGAGQGTGQGAGGDWWCFGSRGAGQGSGCWW